MYDYPRVYQIMYSPWVLKFLPIAIDRRGSRGVDHHRLLLTIVCCWVTLMDGYRRQIINKLFWPSSGHWFPISINQLLSIVIDRHSLVSTIDFIDLSRREIKLIIIFPQRVLSQTAFGRNCSYLLMHGTPTHTSFKSFPLLHFSLRRSVSSWRALWLKNEEISPTTFSLSAILDLLFFFGRTGSSAKFIPRASLLLALEGSWNR